MITGKKIVIPEILLGLVAIAGIYLIFHFDPQYKTGIILGIFSALLSCVFAIFNKTQVSYNAPRTVMLYELTGGFLILTLFMPLYLYLLPTPHPCARQDGHCLVFNNELGLYHTCHGFITAGIAKSLGVHAKSYA
jgi:drug/metabolite transporter (DMT)-like permease